VTKISKFLSKKLLIIAAIPLLIMIYFFDNIKGQYRFMQYCKREGGLLVYEPILKDVGWQASDYFEAKSLFILDHVGFIRFQDSRDGSRIYDLQYTTGDREDEKSYIKLDRDESREIKYGWLAKNEHVIGELRLQKTRFEVIENNTKKLLARYYWFTYSQFDQDKSLFSAPSYVSCFKDRSFANKINTIFSD
jgi:hypothetical protein